MLPFTTKVTHQVVERLCRILAQEEPQHLDIDVNIHTHSCELPSVFASGSSTRRELGLQVLNGAQEHAFEAFVTLLQNTARRELFLPIHLLNRYSQRLYYLLMSPERSDEVLEIYRANGGDLLTYDNYEIIVSRKPQIRDTEAFLIAPGKYTLFMRQVIESRAIHVYRSDFVDLIMNTPPPLNLHAQNVIDALQNRANQECEQPSEGQQLLMFPTQQKKPKAGTITECRECGGPVKEIGARKYFCLDCDWDNLPPLS